MKPTLKLSLLFYLLVISCHTTKNKAESTKSSNTNTSVNMENDKFIKAGYKLGLVEFNEEGKCVYTITDQSTNEVSMFDYRNAKEHIDILIIKIENNK